MDTHPTNRIKASFGALLILIGLSGIIAANDASARNAHEAVELTSWSQSIDSVPQRPVLDAPQAPRKKKNDWAEKTAAFTQCIFGVGAPIGVAIGIATNPELWPYVMRTGSLPAGVGKDTVDWLNTVKDKCAYALS